MLIHRSLACFHRLLVALAPSPNAQLLARGPKRRAEVPCREAIGARKVPADSDEQVHLLKCAAQVEVTPPFITRAVIPALHELS
jgi:hypothetical protein